MKRLAEHLADLAALFGEPVPCISNGSATVA